MEVGYRESFLRDLKKLKYHPIYDRIDELAFETLPTAQDLREIPGIKSMTGYSDRYRIRIGSYRVGLRVEGRKVELVRVLDRRDFYRHFP